MKLDVEKYSKILENIAKSNESDFELKIKTCLICNGVFNYSNYDKFWICKNDCGRFYYRYLIPAFYRFSLNNFLLVYETSSFKLVVSSDVYANFYFKWSKSNISINDLYQWVGIFKMLNSPKIDIRLISDQIIKILDFEDFEYIKANIKRLEKLSFFS